MASYENDDSLREFGYDPDDYKSAQGGNALDDALGVINLGNIFGVDDSEQAKAAYKAAQARQKQKGVLGDLEKRLLAGSGEQEALWDDYGKSVGTYEQRLNEILGNQQGALDQLAGSLGRYKSIEDLISRNPLELAKHDAASRGKENVNLARIGALTGIKETAEEKAMRRNARDELQTQLRGAREGRANELRSRGVYGGGAELVQALAAEEEAAKRQSREDINAQANAQKRALGALGAYQQGAAAMSQADDLLNRFNASLKAQRTTDLGNARGADNTAQQSRASTLYNANTGTNQLATGNASAVQGQKLATTQGKAGAKQNTGNQILELGKMKYNDLGGQRAEAYANQKPGGLLDNLLGGLFG